MKIWNFLWGVSIFGESAFFCEDTWWIWEEYEDDGDNGTAGAFSQMSFCLALAWALAVLQNSGWFCVQPYMSSVLCYMCFVSFMFSSITMGMYMKIESHMLNMKQLENQGGNTLWISLDNFRSCHWGQQQDGSAVISPSGHHDFTIQKCGCHGVFFETVP